MPDAQSRRVVVISLGGTIAMTATEAGGVTPALSADQLLAAVPGLANLNIAVEPGTCGGCPARRWASRI